MKSCQHVEQKYCPAVSVNLSYTRSGKRRKPAPPRTKGKELAAAFRSGRREGTSGFDGWWRLNTFLSSSAILTSFPALPFPAKLCFLQKLLLGFLFQKRAAQAALHFRHLGASKRAKARLLISCYGNKHCRGTENAMQVTLGEPEPWSPHIFLACVRLGTLSPRNLGEEILSAHGWRGIRGLFPESSDQTWCIQLIPRHKPP